MDRSLEKWEFAGYYKAMELPVEEDVFFGFYETGFIKIEDDFNYPSGSITYSVLKELEQTAVMDRTMNPNNKLYAPFTIYTKYVARTEDSRYELEQMRQIKEYEDKEND